MIERPLPWKEYRKLHKTKKVHTEIERIKKHGVILFPDDLVDADKQFKKEGKKSLHEWVERITEDL